MNLETLKKQIRDDEGCKFQVYLDTEALPTFGVGHLITDKDPEMFHIRSKYPFLFDKKLDAQQKITRFKTEVKNKNIINISDKRAQEAFDQDIKVCCDECVKLFPDFNSYLEEVQLIIANMMFNMGRPRLSGFEKFVKAIKAKNYKKAALEMIDSLWYKIQVPNRAKRLVARMEAVANNELCNVKNTTAS